jgi:diadenosine hexaphosphate hydrolase (ATP-forming)
LKPVEQAGGIVLRRDGEHLSVLLVRAKKDPSLWIFPKGHIDPGETAPAAALRETHEEAGIEGELLGPVGDPLEFQSGPELARVQYFLIKPVKESVSGEGREKRWFAFDDARGMLVFESARRLLDRAREIAEKEIPDWRFEISD